MLLQHSPSRTAYATAFMRAVHVRLDDPPPVLDDPVAYQLLPISLQLQIRGQANLRRWSRRSLARDRTSTLMRSQIVVRSRYAEDKLIEARRNGANRYVILGAGLDTFALRQPAPPLPVVEIDHPATQRWKQRLLLRCGITLPEKFTFLPVDFEQDRLDERWIENKQPDFVSWLGTTYYLSREAITETLRVLATRTQDQSQLVLDYWREDPRGRFNPLLWGTRLAVAMQGEPMRSFFDPEEIEELAIEAGWRIKENCPPEEQTRRYLARRKDGLRVPSFAHLLWLER